MFDRRYNRLLVLVAVAALIIGGVILKKTTDQQPVSYKTISACSLLTQSAAQASAGIDVRQAMVKPLQNTQTMTTFCTYRGSTALASLAIRSPRNADGVAFNKDAFDNPPLSSQRLTGLGDAAYWTPALGQLNILENDYWYIVSAGPLVVKERSLQQARQLAEAILK